MGYSFICEESLFLKVLNQLKPDEKLYGWTFGEHQNSFLNAGFIVSPLSYLFHKTAILVVTDERMIIITSGYFGKEHVEYIPHKEIASFSIKKTLLFFYSVKIKSSKESINLYIYPNRAFLASIGVLERYQQFIEGNFNLNGLEDRLQTANVNKKELKRISDKKIRRQKIVCAIILILAFSFAAYRGYQKEEQMNRFVDSYKEATKDCYFVSSLCKSAMGVNPSTNIVDISPACTVNECMIKYTEPICQTQCMDAITSGKITGDACKNLNEESKNKCLELIKLNE